MDLGLKGKRALVLGASRGLGAACAAALAAEGADIIAASRSGNPKVDLSDPASVRALIETVEAAGGVDVLVNNAGGPKAGPARGMAAEDWSAAFQAMALSLFAITDAVLPRMIANGWGRIITIGSSGVVAPIPGLGLSNGVRGAIAGWSKTLAGEVASHGVTVNMVLPGRIATDRVHELDSLKAQRTGSTVEAVETASRGEIPVGRYGRPEEFGAVVAFLASRQASFVTGAMLRVDGGMIKGLLMTFDFDIRIDRRETGSSKWSRYPADVLPLWVADMDFAVAPEIIAAIEERLRHPVLGYSVARQQLREQIVGDVARKYDWAIRPEDIVFLPGVEPGFNMALKALLDPGQKLGLQSPIYAPILRTAGNWQLEALTLPMEAPLEERLRLLETADALLLCNPHNPTGSVLDAQTLRAYAAALGNRPIISDEIHCDILYDGNRHIPIASLAPEIADRTVTLMSASKTYNIAGLKAAFAIVPNAKLRERFEQSRLGMVDSVNALGLEATLAAYRDADAWRVACLGYLERNRNFLVESLRARLPAIRLQPPAATFLAWLDCSALGLADPQQHFLENARVALSAGAEFGASYRQFVRLNFGCSREVLEEGIDRMCAAIGN